MTPHRRHSSPRSLLLALTGLFVLVVLPGCQHGEAIPTATPADVGLSAVKLRAVDAAVEQLIADGKIVGGVVLIVRHGEVCHLEAYGQRDTEPHAPMRTDTIFRIYSMTKPIATAAALILVDEGKLKLDDPVTKYLPELEKVRVQVGYKLVAPNRPMTVADLMRHTAGFSYGFLGHPIDVLYNVVEPLGADDLNGMAERLPQLPLANHPGEKWQYSLSIDVLGLVVERASGQTFDVFLQERIFDPLDMKDTGFHCPPEKPTVSPRCTPRRKTAPAPNATANTTVSPSPRLSFPAAEGWSAPHATTRTSSRWFAAAASCSATASSSPRPRH